MCGTDDVVGNISHTAYQQWFVCVCVASHRWKRDDRQEKVKDPITCLFVLQFIAIQRRDTKEWAIPGVSILWCYISCKNVTSVHFDGISWTIERKFGL